MGFDHNSKRAIGKVGPEVQVQSTDYRPSCRLARSSQIWFQCLRLGPVIWLCKCSRWRPSCSPSLTRNRWGRSSRASCTSQSCRSEGREQSRGARLVGWTRQSTFLRSKSWRQAQLVGRGRTKIAWTCCNRTRSISTRVSPRSSEGRSSTDKRWQASSPARWTSAFAPQVRQ